METKTKSNGQATKPEAAQLMDTAKGAEQTKALSIVKESSDPIAEKLKKIHEVHTLSEKRKKLVETQDDLRTFETDLGESDHITLKNHGGNTVMIKRPEAVKKVLDLLKREVDNAISETNNDLLRSQL